MRDLLLIAILIPCSLKALYQPVFGLLLFTCLGFLAPHSMTWGIGRTFPFSQLAGVTTIVGYLFWSEPKKFPRQREFTLLLALWVMFGVSTLFAIFPDRALDRLIHVSKILLMVCLSTALVNTEYRLHALLRIIALSLGFHGLKGGVFSILSGGNFMVWGPEGTFLEANNSIGLALAMNVPLLYYLAKIETRLWLARLMRVMMVFSYPAIVCTFSRGAWLGLAAATFVIVLRSKHKFLIALALGGLGLLILPFLPQRVVSRYDDLVNYQEESSAQSRFWNWEFCTRVGLAHPLSGGGFDYYDINLYAIYFPEFLERWPGKFWSCHSMWFTIFGEHGFPGFALWMALLSSCLLSLRRIRSYGRTHTTMSWSVPYADMLISAFLVFMVSGSFLDVAYFDMFYQLVAVVAIIKEVVRRRAGRTLLDCAEHLQEQKHVFSASNPLIGEEEKRPSLP
jgi:probable O-glycosylation ligase (exosortase A-associated)